MIYRRSVQAEADFDNIWHHIAVESGNEAVADRFVNSIVERFLLLAERPHIGRKRDDLRIGIRSFPVGDYLVLYPIQDEHVVILRIVHGKRDIPALM